MADTGARSGRGSLRIAVVVLLLGYSALILVGVLAQVGVFVPLGAALGFAIVGWAAGAPRAGLIGAVVTALLFPIALSFRLGPFAFSIGRIVGFAFIIGWLAALSRRRGPLIRRTPFDLPILAFAFSYLLSISANSPFFDGPEYGDAIQATLRVFIDFLVFYWAAVSVMGAGSEHLDRVLRAVALSMGAVAALGLVDWLTGRNVFEFTAPLLPSGLGSQVRAVAEEAARERGTLRRALGTFEGPNKLGAALTLSLPLLIHFATWTVKGRRWPYIAAAAMSTLAGILTISRSVFISIAIVIVVYLAASGAIRFGRGGVAAIVGVMAITLLASPALRDTMFVYFEGLFQAQERSVQARLKDYDNVLVQFDETPAAGSGPATWSPRALGRPGNDKIDQSDPGQLVLDNFVLATLAERGAVGLLTLMGLLLAPIAVLIQGVRTARRPEVRSLRAALLATAVAYAALTAFFDMFAFYAATKLYFLFLAAAAVASGRTLALAPPSAQLEPEPV